MKNIREVKAPKLNDLCRLSNKYNIEDDFFKENLFLTGSGKASLSIILKYLLKEKVFENKTFEIITPEWLGYWVYNQINERVFPSKKLSSKSRAMLVYHQYGFPQNMDKICEYADKYNLKIIEDCAHAIDSSYKGLRLGSIGDFALFSFSKFFFSFALGAIKYKDPNFELFFSNELDDSSFFASSFINSTKLFSEISLENKNSFLEKISKYMVPMSYALYGNSVKPGRISKLNFEYKLDNEIKIRKNRYKYFIQEFNDSGIVDHLEKDGITPYVIPIKLKPSDLIKALDNLRSRGFQTGIYKFDINRFYIEPDYQEVLWIFIHSGISESKYMEQIDILKNIIK